MKARRWRDPAIIAVIGLAFGLTGIHWGLPSARRVALLGESVNKVRADLAERSARDLEARRGRAAILAVEPAETGVDLPRLVRRYLLYSDSPDEPLTLLALASMRPRQLDFNPRMVEYGGLHVYGTGAMMALAHLLGFGRITSDVLHYADHPADIAGLYIAGRLLMVLYNIGIAVLLYLFGRAVAASADRGSAVCGWVAALLWLFSPASQAFSHVINPHLPAAFWGTLAVWLAWRAGRSGNRRAWLGAAAASGAAASCALNASLSVLAPLFAGLIYMRASGRAVARELGLAALVAAACFLALNPYFFANLGVLGEELSRFRHFREPLLSLLSVAFFVALSLPNAIGLVGVVTATFGAARLWRDRELAGRALAVYAVVGLTFTAWLAGSGAREALSVRFATFLLPLMCLLVAAALTGEWPRVARGVVAAVIGLGLAIGTVFNTASFHQGSRDEAGGFVNRQLRAGTSIVVPGSPGPYELPAFDFSRFRLVTGERAPADYVLAVEDKAAPAAPPGFVLQASFPMSGIQQPTPLSFSGRLVRLYRNEESPAPADHQ